MHSRYINYEKERYIATCVNIGITFGLRILFDYYKSHTGHNIFYDIVTRASTA